MQDVPAGDARRIADVALYVAGWGDGLDHRWETSRPSKAGTMSTDEKTILQRLGAEATIDASDRLDTLRDLIRRSGLAGVFSVRLGTIAQDTVLFLDKHSPPSGAGVCVVYRKFAAVGVREIEMYLAGYADAGEHEMIFVFPCRCRAKEHDGWWLPRASARPIRPLTS